MRQWVNTSIDGVKKYYIRPRKIALAYALIVFICLLVMWLYIGSLTSEQLLREERLQVADRVNTIGSSLTLAINQRLMLVTSVHTYMEAKINRDRDLTFADIEQLNEINDFTLGLFTSTVGIRNIAIAPDNVMQFVYPYEENKAVLGYDPSQDDRLYVRAEIQRAIEGGEIVLSLPYNLIQGGQGLIARQAIYVDGRYWGLANVVLDIPSLLEEAGIFPMPDGLELVITDQDGTVFFGSKDTLIKNPVPYEIKLPEGAWTLSAVPTKGWGMY